MLNLAYNFYRCGGDEAAASVKNICQSVIWVKGYTVFSSYLCSIQIIDKKRMKPNKNITRREALKRMGLLMAGAALAATGASSLAACSDEKKKRIILYFTGTGNCLYVARQLADENTEILSIPPVGETWQVRF